MKIVFLNAWAGEVRDALADFINENKHDTDIFCFQEAEGAMPALCDELLKEYSKLSAHKYVTKPDDFYLITCVKNGIDIVASGTVFGDEDGVGLGIYVQVGLPNANLYICNFHGMSRPINKLDSSGRVRQTQGLIDFFSGREGPKVIGGDFNVFPQNQSIQLFAKSGYSDLIDDFEITNTRNRLVWERYPENERQYYSDYVFVTNEVQVGGFSAPGIEVSDHLPLMLEVTVNKHNTDTRKS